jgi:hypothetical protein
VGTLRDDLYPPDDFTYAAVLAGAELFCDRRLVFGIRRISASCSR